jgi:hypothetical protein
MTDMKFKQGMLEVADGYDRLAARVGERQVASHAKKK